MHIKTLQNILIIITFALNFIACPRVNEDPDEKINDNTQNQQNSDSGIIPAKDSGQSDQDSGQPIKDIGLPDKDAGAQDDITDSGIQTDSGNYISNDAGSLLDSGTPNQVDSGDQNDIDSGSTNGIPNAWICDPSYYDQGEDDICDCECGAYDPDCDLNLPTTCFSINNGASLAPSTICSAEAECISDPKCGNSAQDLNGDFNLTTGEEFSEQCDDGNQINGDGCSDRCQIEENYNCTDFPSQCLETPNNWTCDIDYYGTNDGCDCECGAYDPDCDIEESQIYGCPDSENWSCSAEATCLNEECGNAILDRGEDCDDGNSNNEDGCNIKCEQTNGFRCDTTINPSICENTCSNSVIEVDSNETCDDGNDTDGDGCSSLCTIEENFHCFINDNQENICRLKECGNSLIDPSGEYYSSPELGIFETLEQCDDGNLLNNDGCSSQCKIEAGFSCENGEINSNNNGASNCYASMCGNGTIEYSALRDANGDLIAEQCDDGNTDNEDGCSENCFIEEGFGCNLLQSPTSCHQAPLEWQSDVGPFCSASSYGDGYCDCGCGTQDIDCGEVINDRSICEFTFGCLQFEEVNQTTQVVDLEAVQYILDPNNTTQCILNTCGDGTSIGDDLTSFTGNACDDGNNIDGDGCSADCLIEENYGCSLKNSSITTPSLLMLNNQSVCEILPEEWNCPAYYYLTESCFCACGVLNPNCADNQVETCNYYVSEQCDVENGDFINPIETTKCVKNWSCEEQYYADGFCDCGCGVADPDCGDNDEVELCRYNHCAEEQIISDNDLTLCINN